MKANAFMIEYYGIVNAYIDGYTSKEGVIDALDKVAVDGEEEERATLADIRMIDNLQTLIGADIITVGNKDYHSSNENYITNIHLSMVDYGLQEDVVLH